MSLINILKQQKTTALLALIAALGFWFFAYELERSNFPLLISLYGVLAGVCYLIVQKGKTNFWLLAGVAILIRLIFLPVIPNLSQDFYRFVWDGRMLAQGLNPYLTRPQDYIEGGDFSIVAQAQQLYEGMGTLNGSHFTNYPPVNQLIFVIAGFLSGKSVIGGMIILRLSIILADIGTIIYGKKLLQKMGLPNYHIFWYALNPFIIIEMTGNLHFESVMLFFVVWSLYLLSQKKWIWSAVIFSLSISTKLLPLLLLPLFMQYFLSKGDNSSAHSRSLQPFSVRFREMLSNLPKLIYFYLIVLGVMVLTFIPFVTGDFADNFGASIALWFKKFEFNASIYYIIRYIGFKTIGWNIIGDVGPLLPKIVVSIIVLIAFIRSNRSMKQMISGMLIAIFFYFLLSTTVHPWYVATPLLLCVFTKYRFPLVWSVTVMFSYSAYTVSGFEENLWFVAAEYIIVVSYFIWEVFLKKNIVTAPLKID